MPAFTEAALIAAGTGALLWVVLAAEASARRRTWVGLAGFVALEAATFSRYTNIVVLGCAVIAVLVAWRLRAGRLPGSAVVWWLGPVGVFGAGVAIFNAVIYGGPLRSGYRPGEITFSLGALGANLRYMPAHLIQAMPVLVLGLGGLAGIAVTWLRGRRAGGQQAAAAGRDLAVALALAACWAAVWVLYATYTWTAAPGLSTLQAARFYVPALGAISLLGAWLLVRVPRRQPVVAVTTLAVVAALFGLGGWAFHDMYQFPFGSQLVVVPGPGGTVELEPGPGVMTGGPGRVAPGGSGRAVRIGPSASGRLAREVPGLHDCAARRPVTESDREFRVQARPIRTRSWLIGWRVCGIPNWMLCTQPRRASAAARVLVPARRRRPESAVLHSPNPRAAAVGAHE